MNEKRVFSNEMVREELEKHRVVLIRADLTERNEALIREMQHEIEHNKKLQMSLEERLDEERLKREQEERLRMIL